MKSHRPITVVGISAVVGFAVILAVLRGPEEGAVFAAVVSVLVLAYVVRHLMRSRLVYDRRRSVSESREPERARAPSGAPRQAPDADVRHEGGAA
jgi:hypothetical protein